MVQGLAAGVERQDVVAILLHNGREELAHAHRMAKAVGKLTGSAYPVPAPERRGPQPLDFRPGGGVAGRRTRLQLL